MDSGWKPLMLSIFCASQFPFESSSGGITHCYEKEEPVGVSESEAQVCGQ